MRKTTNLVLAAAMAATAFATTAASAQRASECDVPEGAEVVTDKGLETTINSGAVPIITRSGYDFVIDIRAPKDTVTILLNWADDGLSDFDLTVHDAEENELGRANEASTTGPEIVTLKLEDCMHIVVGAVAYPGDPTQDLDLAFEVG